MTSPESGKHLRRALDALDRWGLLLLQDAAFPSLVTLVTGEPVRGSWWSHPKGPEIFRAAGALDHHPDLTSAKLISGKVTFVHRALWPTLIAIGRAREPWQLEGLTKDARELLARVDRETGGRPSGVRASGKPAKALEERLLVASRQVHTDTGAHALELLTWDAFARKAKLRLPKIAPDHARAAVEQCLHALREQTGAKGRLPWTRWQQARGR